MNTQNPQLAPEIIRSLANENARLARKLKRITSLFRRVEDAGDAVAMAVTYGQDSEMVAALIGSWHKAKGAK